MPLPEKIQFRSHTSSQTDLKSISIREHSLTPGHQARLRRKHIVQSSRAGPTVLTGLGTNPSTAVSDDVESFRRIHVQPYNGNFLRALFEIGENLRTLLIDMSAIDDDENELIDEAPFAERYTDIIKDFESLRNTDISPLLEIRDKTKHMSHTKNVMRRWVLRTARLLFPPKQSFPIRPSVRQAIVPIRDWLQKPTDWSPGSSSIAPSLWNNNWETSPEEVRMFDHYHDLVRVRSRNRDTPINTIPTTRDIYTGGNGWCLTCRPWLRKAQRGASELGQPRSASWQRGTWGPIYLPRGPPY